MRPGKKPRLNAIKIHVDQSVPTSYCLLSLMYLALDRFSSGLGRCEIQGCIVADYMVWQINNSTAHALAEEEETSSRGAFDADSVRSKIEYSIEAMSQVDVGAH